MFGLKISGNSCKIWWYLSLIICKTGLLLILQGIPLVERKVTPSISLRFLLSMRRLKCDKKSIPIIGLLTSAIMNGQLNDLLRPKSSLSNFCPYVLILLPLAAYNSSLQIFFCSKVDGGTTDTSAPVSIKNCVAVSVSLMYKRLSSSLWLLAVAENRGSSFPTF